MVNRIIGGKETSGNEYPWQVLIIEENLPVFGLKQFTGDMVIIVFQMQFYRLLLWKMANILRFVVEALYPLDMY